MDRITDRPDMTSAVDRGLKAATQTNNQNNMAFGERNGSVVECPNSGARGRGFATNLCCVVSLSKTLYSPEVLVISRKLWLRPDMTEKLLSGTLNLNTNKPTNIAHVNCLQHLLKFTER